MKKLLLSLLLTSTICLANNAPTDAITDETVLKKTSLEQNPLSLLLVTKVMKEGIIVAFGPSVFIIKSNKNDFDAAMSIHKNAKGEEYFQCNTSFANIESTLGTEFANAIKDKPFTQDKNVPYTDFFVVDSLTRCIRDPKFTECVTRYTPAMLEAIAKIIK